MFRELVVQLRMFTDVVNLIQHSDDQEIDEDVVLSALAVQLPFEDVDRMFATLVNWGRHAGLFDRDADRGRLFIEREEKKEE
jgi:NitT/TauT family transport system ATP-binding protein